jgi:4-hydroxy-tetrahydrodipicolinate synthase
MEKFRPARYQGIFPAAMTMFDQDGNLDEAATLAHWKWLASQGIHGLVIAGTSGEFIALTREERQRLFELAVREFKGKLPILAGTGHYSTKLTIEISQKAQDAGIDAFIIIMPYYQSPPKPAILEHYRIVRRHTDLPIMLYHNPRNSASVELAPSEIAQLVDEDVVHMVKSTFESVVPVHDLVYLVGDRVPIFYGSFLSAYEGLLAGAHGWISGILNVAPSQALAMFNAIKVEKNIKKAFSIWMNILSVVHLGSRNEIGPVSDIAIYRAMLELWGRPAGYCRLPFFPLNDEQKQSLRARLEATGWLNYEHVLETGQSSGASIR